MCSRPVCMLDAGQVCGTECIKEDKVFTSDLQVIYPMKLQGYHQFSASAVELEFLRSERRLRSGKHFA